MQKIKLSVSSKEKIASLLSSVICIVCGLLIGFILLLIISPSNAPGIFGSIIKGGFADPSGWRLGLGNQLTYTAPLIMCGLSVLFAYKTGLFNIGVAGQYTVGAFGAIFFALVVKSPWYVCVFMAILFAAIWGAIPGILKAFFNVNEVITSIMMNWIGLYMVNDFFNGKIKVNISLGRQVVKKIFYPAQTLPISGVNSKALLPTLGLDKLFGGVNSSGVEVFSKLTIAIIIAILMSVIIDVILKHTTFGYELRACGLNKNASEYAGIKGKRNIVLSMAIAGGLAGMGASFLYLSGIETFPQSVTSLSSLAFNGIPVAFMANLNPIGVIFAAFLMAHIKQGSGLISLDLATNKYALGVEMADIISGSIIYFCAFAPLVLMYLRKLIVERKKEINNRITNVDQNIPVIAESNKKESEGK